MRWTELICAALALATAPAAAVPPVEAFGALPSIDLIALSPDGAQIALAVTDHNVRQVQVRDVASHKLVATVGQAIIMCSLRARRRRRLLG
jgi:hypothetical protein